MPTRKRLTKKRVRRRRSHRNIHQKNKKSRRKTRINKKNRKNRKNNSNKNIQKGGYDDYDPPGGEIPKVKTKGLTDTMPPWPGSNRCKSDCFEVCTIM